MRDVMITGPHGIATLTREGGESLRIVIHRFDGAAVTETFTGRWACEFGCAQAASEVAHGPDADLCTAGPQGFCPHVEVS
jgi:hypothetical protein